MDRELPSTEILKKGSYVVTDTDYLERYDEKKMKNKEYTGPRVYMTYTFEEKYQRLKQKDEQYEYV